MMVDQGIAVMLQGKPLMTPEKKEARVPTQALADAIAQEWSANGKYVASKMPLTSLTYTSIDRIATQKDAIVESLLTYVDTDTLSYRATSSDKLAAKQEQLWTPLLAWLGKRLDAKWEFTSGLMPIDQSPQLHQAVRRYLEALGAMQLAGACVLSSGYSSLALMLAVLEKHIDAEEAFRLSRLEEDWQAEQWGHDEEADARAERLKAEILAADGFLRLLEAA